MKSAVYPGSFDPVTYGHIDLIRRGARLFDKIIVAAIRNPEKASLFSLDERMELLRQVVKDIPNVEVDSFDGLLVHYMARKKSAILLRGLRAVSDFDYEFQIASTNQQMAPEIETLLMMTSSEYSYLSSSLVKQIAKLGGPISKFVPTVVEKALARMDAKNL